jgi:predicted O-methyltransferase YrrM
VLELGTSNGYSTIWLADAVAASEGCVTTIEIDAGRAQMARENFARAGVEERIDLRIADAAEVLAASPSNAWDVIFLDAERYYYVGYWPDLIRSLRPLGLVDNVLSHADEVADFRRLVDGSPEVTSAVVGTGAGLLLVTNEPAEHEE